MIKEESLIVDACYVGVDGKYRQIESIHKDGIIIYSVATRIDDFIKWVKNKVEV